MHIKSYLTIIPLITLCFTTVIHSSTGVKEGEKSVVVMAMAEAEQMFLKAQTDDKLRRKVIALIVADRLKGQDWIIQLLPSEIIQDVLKWLSLTDLVSCSEVCKKWQVLARDNALWNPIQTNLFAGISQADLDSSSFYKTILGSTDTDTYYKLCSSKKQIVQQFNTWQLEGDFRIQLYHGELRHSLGIVPVDQTIMKQCRILDYATLKKIMIYFSSQVEGNAAVKDFLAILRSALPLTKQIEKLDREIKIYFEATETDQFSLTLSTLHQYIKFNALVLKAFAEQLNVHIDGF